MMSSLTVNTPRSGADAHDDRPDHDPVASSPCDEERRAVAALHLLGFAARHRGRPDHHSPWHGAKDDNQRVAGPEEQTLGPSESLPAALTTAPTPTHAGATLYVYRHIKLNTLLVTRRHIPPGASPDTIRLWLLAHQSVDKLPDKAADLARDDSTTGREGQILENTKRDRLNYKEVRKYETSKAVEQQVLPDEPEHEADRPVLRRRRA